MKGYKATDENMQCLGYQFKLGEWAIHEGELIPCKSGFHFCEQPSGVFSYYYDPKDRVFEVEAEDVLDTPFEPGADFKRVCRRIRLIREVCPAGNQNTGDQNTGYRNTGYRNTGHQNTGDRNAGDLNTGDRNTGNLNTGDQNTGYQNTGYRNTGDQNTGYRNTGHLNTGNLNTGYQNTGDQNTGHRNTGDGNTGYGNATSHSSGFFCMKEPAVLCFDQDTGMTRADFMTKYAGISIELCDDLSKDKKIDFKKYQNLPGITAKKLQALHRAFKVARNNLKKGDRS